MEENSQETTTTQNTDNKLIIISTPTGNSYIYESWLKSTYDEEN